MLPRFPRKVISLAVTTIGFLCYHCYEINAEACTTLKLAALRRLYFFLRYILHAVYHLGEIFPKVLGSNPFPATWEGTPSHPCASLKEECNVLKDEVPRWSVLLSDFQGMAQRQPSSH